MSVTTIFNKGHVLWQEVGDEGIPELPIVLHVDSGGTICLEQEQNTIVLQPSAVKELCHELVRLQKAVK